MARIPQGILGGLRGRVGNVVGAAWKGINYIRSMPLSVANPNTAAQQAQRGAFTQVVAAARFLLAELIATYWDPFARAMSGYNHFISVNIDAFTTGGLTIPANFSSGRGVLTGFTNLLLVADGVGDDLTLTWDDNSGEGDALATDEVVVVWYNETQVYLDFATAPAAIRSDASMIIPDSRLVTGDQIRIWPFFARPDIEKISDSTATSDIAA